MKSFFAHERPCHWDRERTCYRKYLCEGCEHQPKDEDKVNGKADPLPIKWVPGYFGGLVPECPVCGELPYRLDRCIFCGQRFTQDEEVGSDEDGN